MSENRNEEGIREIRMGDRVRVNTRHNIRLDREIIVKTTQPLVVVDVDRPSSQVEVVFEGISNCPSDFRNLIGGRIILHKADLEHIAE